jgi:hypothetical protein
VRPPPTPSFTSITFRTATRRRAAYSRDLSTAREYAAEVRLFQLAEMFRQRWPQAQPGLAAQLAAARWRLSRQGLPFQVLAACLDGAVVLATARGVLPGARLVALLVALERFARFRHSFAWPSERPRPLPRRPRPHALVPDHAGRARRRAPAPGAPARR